jgi:hypothetical protein
MALETSLVTVPNSLDHLLESASLMTSEPRCILAAVADGNGLLLELDQPTNTLLLTGRLPPIRLSETAAASSPRGLLGRTVSILHVFGLHGSSGTVLATWEARRVAEDWEDVPVVTFVLVGTEDGAYVLERFNVLAL